jgi:hypothetical protein
MGGVMKLSRKNLNRTIFWKIFQKIFWKIVHLTSLVIPLVALFDIITTDVAQRRPLQSQCTTKSRPTHLQPCLGRRPYDDKFVDVGVDCWSSLL